ncbi:MAG: TetR/AcrR family transcriptional regulator [Clostridia bacterium]|nr:TetR/AcrR family transcriptional regulator [Clostridia bacterium]
MVETNNPISIRSKKKIAEALIALMNEVPFVKITVKDIVAKAGLTRQTFYHNFETKEEVLKYTMDELFDEMFQFMVDKKIINWEDIIWFYFRFWQRNSDLLKLLIKNNLVYVLDAKYTEYFKLFQILQFRKTDLTNMEAEYVYSFISGAMTRLLVSWINSGMVMPARDMAKLVMDIMDGSILQRNQNGDLISNKAIYVDSDIEEL